MDSVRLQAIRTELLKSYLLAGQQHAAPALDQTTATASAIYGELERLESTPKTDSLPDLFFWARKYWRLPGLHELVKASESKEYREWRDARRAREHLAIAPPPEAPPATDEEREAAFAGIRQKFNL